MGQVPFLAEDETLTRDEWHELRAGVPPTPSASSRLVALAETLGTNGFAEQRWRQEAACRGQDPEWWHPRRGASIAKRKAVCHSCPVQAECLDYALEHGERWGVWGGLSEAERRRARRERVQVDVRASC